MPLEFVKHPEYALYRDLGTGLLYTPAYDETGEVQLVEAEELLADYQYKQERLARQQELLIEAQLVQIPRYSESRRAAETPSSRAMAVYEPEEVTHRPDITGTTVSIISKLPKEFRIALVVIAILAFASSFVVVPVAPKIAQTITNIVAPPPPAPASYSSRLTRIPQLDQSQYDSPDQYNAYSPSACSAAALTAILDSFGANWHISTILDEEIALGAITPSQGLVRMSGIPNTAAHFGFVATPVSSLDQAIQVANSGTPVIVDILPGAAWPGGHFVDVAKGSADTVALIDSWSTNYQTISKQRFLSWGIGKIFSIAPSQYEVLQNPTVSADQINALLANYHSPVSGQGQMIVNLGVKYHIDPAYVVATFGNESTFGTKGESTKSLSPGNLRCIASARCADGYAQMDSWEMGFEKLYDLLANSQYYITAGKTIPDTIIPTFAPSGDGNSPSSYIANVKHIEDVLRSGGTQI